MTRAEIENRMNKLEDLMFELKMIDRWSGRDRQLYDTYFDEFLSLKKSLKEVQ